MDINKVTKIPLIIVMIILIVGGLLSVLKGCSPEWKGGEGGAAIGGMLQSFDFLCYGTILWLVSGWALVLYRASTAQNRKVNICGAIASLITGLLLLYSGILNYNPFTKSNSKYMYQIPGELIWLLSGLIFIIIGIKGELICGRRYSG